MPLDFVGGEEAVKRKMQDWINEHPDLAAGQRSIAISGTTIGQVEPRSAEEAVNGLMADAEKSVRKTMQEYGEMNPWFIAETRDGQQTAIALKNPSGPVVNLIPTLHTMAKQLDFHAGVVQMEVWMAPTDRESPEVRPSKSSQRTEAVVVFGLAQGIHKVVVFDIERTETGVNLKTGDSHTFEVSPWLFIFNEPEETSEALGHA